MNATALPQQKNGNRALLSILQIVGPVLLAMVAGYGAVRFAEGDTQARLKTIETQQTTQIETNKQFMTREEMKLFMDATTRELNLIHDDVKAIRSDLRGTK